MAANLTLWSDGPAAAAAAAKLLLLLLFYIGLIQRAEAAWMRMGGSGESS